jgi:hypothetical protein
MKLSEAPNELLEIAIERGKKKLHALEMANLADVRVSMLSSYPEDSDGVLDRNFTEITNLRYAIAGAETELKSRKQV